ncbi:hypothetical protein [Xanthomonas albilineans]|uniref:hypothetical protein n=2 Tax=Xanthomonas albilineans TaxID=29447 RepID=UPI0005F314F6|nr:hypothetical protein [Xanthomonas albilineans]
MAQARSALKGAGRQKMWTGMVHERGIQDRKNMKIDRGSHSEILKLTPTHPPLVPPGHTAQTVAWRKVEGLTLDRTG